MTRFPLVAALGAVILLGVSACTTESPAPSAQSESPSPSRHSSPTPSPTAQNDLLFTITANLKSAEGSTVHVTESAFAPRASDAAAESLIRNAGCGEDLDSVPTPDYIRVDATATVEEGPVPDSDYLLQLGTSAVGAELPSPQAFTGDWHLFQAYCSDGTLAMPGSASGYVVYDGPDAWTKGRWGMGANTGAGDNIRIMTAETCDVEFGPAADSTDIPAGWRTADTRLGCWFGARGD